MIIAKKKGKGENMGIIFNEKEKQFHIFNKSLSYVIGICEDGDIGQLYFGKPIRTDQKLHDYQSYGIRPLCCNEKDDEKYTKELALLEYPAFGDGDFGSSAYEVLQENGSRVTKFTYQFHRIYKGKAPIPGLPATYTNEDEEADSLELVCRDLISGLEVTLCYTVWENYSAICRHTKLKNTGDKKLKIEQALSCNVDFPDTKFTWLQFEGAWGRERSPKERDISSGITAIESLRGHSSANYNPFVIIKRKNTDELQGEAFGFNLVYSGNYIAKAQADTFGKLRFNMGINPKWFQWPLEPGEEFNTPEVIITYTSNGLNDLSQNIHRLMNNNLVRSAYKNKPRPILLNNWEATEMDFDEEKILKIASKGKEAGVELFVLDDGWFGKRNDDFAGLGDWYVNTDKLPDGISGLSKKINELGLKFGLWIEPEMVNEDSDMYRQHPDWVLAAPYRPRTLGRHQMVLDYSKPEVVDNIYNQLYEVISNASIDYIKWDMNRSITECYSQDVDKNQQGMVYHKYIMGVYSLYERLRKAFPHILFESCASGGARFDAGMLYYAPQAWCSDDTDGHERVKIQYGTSYGYPVSMVGSHVSASPNLQTHRAMTIDDRANVAYYGTFGYELDLNEISEEDFESVKEQIKFMKEYRELFQYGNYYRLQSPFENNISAWMVVSDDKQTAIVTTHKTENIPNWGIERIKLQGLNPDIVYTINDKDDIYGDYVMNAGISLMNKERNWYESDGDYTTHMYILKGKVTK